jgi:hypothetical protein
MTRREFKNPPPVSKASSDIDEMIASHNYFPVLITSD